MMVMAGMMAGMFSFAAMMILQGGVTLRALFAYIALDVAMVAVKHSRKDN
jgi:hypothetical protein